MKIANKNDWIFFISNQSYNELIIGKSHFHAPTHSAATFHGLTDRRTDRYWYDTVNVMLEFACPAVTAPVA